MVRKAIDIIIWLWSANSVRLFITAYFIYSWLCSDITIILTGGGLDKVKFLVVYGCVCFIWHIKKAIEEN